MSESEVKKCPKCGGQMVEASRLVAHAFSLWGAVLPGVGLAKKRDVLGDRIIPFYCEDCGYMNSTNLRQHDIQEKHLRLSSKNA